MNLLSIETIDNFVTIRYRGRYYGCRMKKATAGRIICKVFWLWLKSLKKEKKNGAQTD
jgi:hypothetical protein